MEYELGVRLDQIIDKLESIEEQLEENKGDEDNKDEE